MDRIKKGADVITSINKYRNDEIRDHELITVVNSYFDDIKNQPLSQADFQFLKFISNVVGIPHYFDLLSKFNKIEDFEVFNLNTFSAIFYESVLHRSESLKLHKYQKTVVDTFKRGELNRFFLSASTSFGKTFVAYEVIRKMKYKNVVLIFPTIALLSENLERINTNSEYSDLETEYTIHTLSEVDDIGDKNIFIYTPERFLSFLERNTKNITFDFVFIDEVYKIDNEYIVDDQTKENERDVAYRIATHYSLKGDTDILMAGPYIEFSKSDTNSFNLFLKENHVKVLNFNNIETVGKKYVEVTNRKQLIVDEGFIVNFENNRKIQRLMKILSDLEKRNENTILYCPRRGDVERYAKYIIKSENNNRWDFSGYEFFIKHLEENFHKDWVLINALKNGVGIHHGLVPKYIQKEIVSLFNEGKLSILISTTTITEGVNTSAKNLIVVQSKKGDKDLKRFDAKNIAGRAGRFQHHYSGRVIVLQNKFMDAVDSSPLEIKHKNYDVNSVKDEIDLFYSKEQYLSIEDLGRKKNIVQEQLEREIPEEIMDRFKVVSREDKIKVYDRIKELTQDERAQIRKLIAHINTSSGVDFEGLQILLNVVRPIVNNEKLSYLIDQRIGDREYSLFVFLLHYYMRDGFAGSMRFKIDKGGKVDEAIRQTADFIYNTLKYQAVKYLGVFNLMYKFIRTTETNKTFDEVSGIDILLLRLEYNALTEEGRLVGDYGVPHKILEFYENPNSDFAKEISDSFDEYERSVFEKVKKIVEGNSN